jgi:hypothetical protein
VCALVQLRFQPRAQIHGLHRPHSEGNFCQPLTDLMALVGFCQTTHSQPFFSGKLPAPIFPVVP